ncbi:hypothetical protein JIR23_06420 [Bradyrhizobium diazoefficiens]|nr:hypothetical protein [Bradyrhizobium diazoefficiens]QQN65404.1 hypothetical protein JIR23_06420 [Bradyrhizobium diazoefficiens]
MGALDRPFIVLLEQDRTEADNGILVKKMPTTSVVTIVLLNTIATFFSSHITLL